MPQVGAAIAAVGKAFGALSAGGFFSSFVGKLLVSVAASALARALAPKPRQAGIKTSTTAAGGVNPCSFVLGRYATAGFAVCPAMSHSAPGQNNNNYLTYVIELGDMAGATLDGLILDGEYASIGGTAHPDYGTPVGGRFAGHAWVRFRNGTQTAADAGLLSKYGSYPERPWSADMIGRGVPYAIVTFLYNREIFNNLPECRFVLGGIALYDPREDSTVGGSGSQRWDNAATWQPTENPAVMIYNILRGVMLPDGSIWGGDAQASDLPLSNWFAAMNVCDETVGVSGGGTEARYRAGFEVTVDEEPSSVIEELLKACAGDIAEVGGTWFIQLGGPALPVYYFSDDDIIVSSPQDYDPFPSLQSTYNGIHASYPEPTSLWEPRDAPPRYNATYEADDAGRRLVADLQLPAVFSGSQVQRLMRGYIEEERRFRRHALTLPPEAARLAPLDTVAWASTRNGYVDKLFEVAEIADDLQTGSQRVSLRERDPDDYDWDPGYELPSTPAAGGSVIPSALLVRSFTLSAATITDAGGAGRRPALQISWDGADEVGIRGLQWEVRLVATGAVVQRGSVLDVQSGEIYVADGILPATEYEARATYVADRPTDWTAWNGATTPNIRIGADDLASGAVTGTKLALLDNAAVFSEFFDADSSLDEWEFMAGLSPGEVSIAASADARQGGKVLLAGNNSGADQVWMVSRQLIPFDRNKNYRMKVGIRQLAGSPNIIYAGYVGVAADGVTLVNRDGANTVSAQHYHCVGSSTVAVVGSYTEYQGYTIGVGAPNGTGIAGTLAAPGRMHSAVRYLRPMVLVNFENQQGRCAIDYVRVETVSDAALIAEGAVGTAAIQDHAVTTMTQATVASFGLGGSMGVACNVNYTGIAGADVIIIAFARASASTISGDADVDWRIVHRGSILTEGTDRYPLWFNGSTYLGDMSIIGVGHGTAAAGTNSANIQARGIGTLEDITVLVLQAKR